MRAEAAAAAKAAEAAARAEGAAAMDAAAKKAAGELAELRAKSDEKSQARTPGSWPRTRRTERRRCGRGRTRRLGKAAALIVERVVNG